MVHSRWLKVDGNTVDGTQLMVHTVDGTTVDGTQSMVPQSMVHSRWYTQSMAHS